MPLGRVKWYSLEKGFGFIESEEGADVYLASSALPAGVATVKPGTKLLIKLSSNTRTFRPSLPIEGYAEVAQPS